VLFEEIMDQEIICVEAETVGEIECERVDVQRIQT